jgi:hypothetical protein
VDCAEGLLAQVAVLQMAKVIPLVADNGYWANLPPLLLEPMEHDIG